MTQPQDACPKCGGKLARTEDGPAWCTSCEWNLGAYDRTVQPARGWRLLDRLGHRLAFRLDRALFEEFSENPPDRPGWTPARMLLVGFSVLLILVMLGSLAVGAWLVVRAPSGRSVVVGLALIAVAAVLRPRLGRRPARRRRLGREEAPTLFALVDRVAAAVGAAAPRMIAVDEDFTAATDRVGLRRQTVLLIGVPFWITLGPAERVALLAHELGHQVNRDPARGLLTQPALDTFRKLASVTGANRSIRQVVYGQVGGGGLVRLFQFLLELGLWLVSRVFLLVHLGLSAVGLRDHQRAEYLADRVAVEVAGTAAVASLTDQSLVTPQVADLIVSMAETQAPDAWLGMAKKYQESRREMFPALRQLSARNTSLWSAHPPMGLRARMVQAWPNRLGSVYLTPSESAAIDAELAGWYRAVHRLVLGTRTFRGPAARTAPATRPAPAARRSEPRDPDPVAGH